MPTTGTKQWAKDNLNIFKGCAYNCVYCYAKMLALRRNQIATEKDWETMEFKHERWGSFCRKGFTEGVKMIHSTHDITPISMKYSFRLIKSLLKSGNKVLVVSKPSEEVFVQNFANEFEPSNSNLHLRFTITNTTPFPNEWEPFAPPFKERLACLKFLFEKGFNTSVSIEPYLEDPGPIIDAVVPYVSESIWLGPINPSALSPLALRKYNEDKKLQEISSPLYIHKNLIRWVLSAHGKLVLKDSITNLGLQVVIRDGLDYIIVSPKFDKLYLHGDITGGAP